MISGDTTVTDLLLRDSYFETDEDLSITPRRFPAQTSSIWRTASVQETCSTSVFTVAVTFLFCISSLVMIFLAVVQRFVLVQTVFLLTLISFVPTVWTLQSASLLTCSNDVFLIMMIFLPVMTHLQKSACGGISAEFVQVFFFSKHKRSWMETDLSTGYESLSLSSLCFLKYISVLSVVRVINLFFISVSLSPLFSVFCLLNFFLSLLCLFKCLYIVSGAYLLSCVFAALCFSLWITSFYILFFLPFLHQFFFVSACSFSPCFLSLSPTCKSACGVLFFTCSPLWLIQ